MSKLAYTHPFRQVWFLYNTNTPLNSSQTINVLCTTVATNIHHATCCFYCRNTNHSNILKTTHVLGATNYRQSKPMLRGTNIQFQSSALYLVRSNRVRVADPILIRHRTLDCGLQPPLDTAECLPLGSRRLL